MLVVRLLFYKSLQAPIAFFLENFMKFGHNFFNGKSVTSAFLGWFAKQVLISDPKPWVSLLFFGVQFPKNDQEIWQNLSKYQ